METFDLLSAKITPEISEAVLLDIMKLLAANIVAWMKEYAYSPRDPPRKRREVMARTIDVNLETLLRFICFILMRGGNPKRALKNLDEKTRGQITVIMDQMKVKGFVAKGMFSTWQWMTSYWDHTVILCQMQPKLLESFFVIGDYRFAPLLPQYCYVIGGLHLFKGASDQIQVLVKNEMFRHQHFLITTKNMLDPKKAAKNKDNDDYKAARVTQANYMDFQMKDDPANFHDKHVAQVRAILKFDLNTFTAENLKATHDFIADPYSAAAKLFRDKV